ncbi:MAG: hypothetical protein HXS44_13620 [Theionarchaea archaeon]|nr:hypothetical protein [Theionarchaea archaeon]
MNYRILFIVILVVGCISQTYTAEEAQQVAADYIKRAPTYTFDGIAGTFQVSQVEPLDCKGCFEVTIKFTSGYPGFGARSAYFLVRRLTPHTAKVRVEKGQVTQAIIDDIWDEMKQQSIVK